MMETVNYILPSKQRPIENGITLDTIVRTVSTASMALPMLLPTGRAS
jgi:hypothetical protein